MSRLAAVFFRAADCGTLRLVGKVIRFRRGRRLRSLDEFDRRQRIRFWPEPGRSPLRSLLSAARPFLLFAILCAIWVAMDPALVEPPEFLAGEPEQVSEVFSRCGLGRSHACVIDGDTFKLGDRKVRIIGIDAPETHPARCAEEARLGEEATAKLQALLNQGDVEMVAPIYRTQDRYGRDLRVIRRKLPDGRMQSIASDMRESGLAYRYLGGFKMDWC
jgi:endonuclease YncB( thermonuclease family)